MLGRPEPMRDRVAMYNSNTLKVGVFGANCSSSRTATTVPERWSASWPDTLALARIADEAGLDFILPIARWKGYGGETDFHGTTLETITWATGLLATTKRVTVFGTVHAPLFHPLIAAKQIVTADQVGEGRFGLNLVAGWNEGEFDMFGVTQRDHETRYAYAQEWLDAVKSAWTEPDTFDFDGAFIKLKNVRAFPKPFGGARPLIMNAGSSKTGQEFALKNCDALFTTTGITRKSLEGFSTHVDAIKEVSRGYNREVEVFTVGQVVCRPTQQEADDYYHHANIDHADWGAIEGMLAQRGITAATVPPEKFAERKHYFAANAIGGYPFVGTPDKIAEELAIISSAGVRGIGLSFVNFLNEVPYFCAEVLPRLAKMGLRERKEY